MLDDKPKSENLAEENTVTARRTLADWLGWQETLHPRAIDLGLERVREVALRLQLLPMPAQCITVAGTNGKGSSALMLAHLLGLNARVGVYTSPYLLRYNERVRIDGVEASDAQLCTAFGAVDAARQETSLTYFEFGTLAALWLFKQAKVEYCVLEVGMGGRLDAVNIVDAHAALITSIGLDHTDWLGDNREAIGTEKAGVFRKNSILVCAERNPPDSLAQRAAALQTPLHTIGEHFDIDGQNNPWQWHCKGTDDAANRDSTPHSEFTLPACPGLLADNVAGVLAVLTLMQAVPDLAQASASLADFSVPGRRQVITGEVEQVLDVAHNLEAIQVLVDWLAAHPVRGVQHIVVGMLANKPVETLGPVLASAGSLYAGGLQVEGRGLSGAVLAQRLQAPAQVFVNVATAWRAAWAQAKPGDRIVVCGSFYSVAAVLEAEPGLAGTVK